MAQQPACPDREQLHDFLLGRLSADQTDRVQAHLPACSSCLGTVESLEADDTLFEAVRAQARARSGREDEQVEALIDKLSGLYGPPDGGNSGDPGPTASAIAGQVRKHVSPEPLPTTDVPDRLGPYRLLKVLGMGGMGIVYQARHEALKRIVAIKMISAGRHAAPEHRSRFKVEVESVARLQHPNIVQIYEVGEADGEPYCALEFVAGGSLDKKLAGTPLVPAEAAELVETLARAMHAAHEQGIIHRDLKPANVLLTLDGIPKITDFGLARQTDEVSQTQLGTVMGTPSYMAPEQAEGRIGAVGPAADIYALGAILYECLTGRPPFRAATARDTVLQVIRDEPVPPRQLQPRTPRDLETVCLKCLQKERGKRYASALELAQDLRRFLNGEPIRARPVGQVERAARWCFRNPWLALSLTSAALCLLVGASVSAWYAVANSNLATANLKLATKATQKQREAELRTREASWNAYVARMPAVEQTWRNANFGRLELLMNRGDESLAGIAPFQGWEWTYLRDQCRQGSRPLLGDAPYTGVFACCRRTGTIAVGRLDGGIDLWDPTANKVLRTLPCPNKYAVCLVWHPDGLHLAISYEDGDIHIWNTADGAIERSLAGSAWTLQPLAWNPDGSRLATSGLDGVIKIWDPRDGQLLVTLTANRPAKQKHFLEGILHVQDLSWHPDGVRLTSAHRHNLIVTWDTKTGARLFETSRPNYESPLFTAKWSPDGKWLATGFSIVDEQGRVQAKIDGHDGQIWNVCWNADGTRLLSAGGDKTTRLWSWDGKNAQLLETQRVHPVNVLSATWTQVENRVLSGSGGLRGQSGSVRISTIGQSVRQAKLWTHAGLKFRRVGWSPDGKWLALGGMNGVQIRAAQSMNVVPHQGLAETRCYSFAWSADSQSLAVGGWGKISICPLTAKAVTPPLDRTATIQGSQAVAWSPDGRWLATANYIGETLVWDTHSWKSAPPLNDSTPYDRLAWSPDSKRLAVGWNGGALRVWDVSERKFVATNTQRFGMKALKWSPDGRLIAVVNGDGLILDAQTLAIVHRIGASAPRMQDAAWSPDGLRLATGNPDGVQIFDAATGDLLLTLPCLSGNGAAAAVHSVAWRPDGRCIAAVCADDTVRIWGSDAVELPTRTEFLETGILARVGRDAVVGAPVADDKLPPSDDSPHFSALADLTSEDEPQPPPLDDTGPATVAATPSTPSAESPGAEPPGELACFRDLPNYPISAAISPDGRQAWVGLGHSFRDGKTVLAKGDFLILGYDVPSRREKFRLSDHKNIITSLAQSSNGSRLYSCAWGRNVIEWDAGQGTTVRSFQGPEGGRFVTFLEPDPGRALWGDDSGVVRLWDLAGEKEIVALQGHTSAIRAVAVSADGQRAMSGGGTVPGGGPSSDADYSVRLWDLSKGTELQCLRGHTGDVTSVCFAPGGRSAYSAGQDGTIRRWNLDTGREEQRIDGPFASNSLAVAGDGRLLVAGDNAGALHVWDVQRWREVEYFTGHTAIITCVAISPDSRYAVTGAIDHTVRLWRLPDPDRIGHPAPGPFVVQAKGDQPERSYATLADAVLAADGRDTIEIRGNGPFSEHAIRCGTRSLVIRAGKGFVPLLQIDSASLAANRPLIETLGPLVLEGLHFRLTEVSADPTQYTFVRSVGAPLFAAHCRFELHSNRTTSALELRGSPRAEIHHCELGGRFQNAIAWSPAAGGQLSITDSLSWGVGAFLRCSQPAQGGAALRLERSTVVCERTIQHYYGQLPDALLENDSQLQIASRFNIIQTDGFLGLHPFDQQPVPAADHSRVPNLIAWEERDNLYRGVLLRLYAARGDSPSQQQVDVAPALEEWNALWDQESTSSLMADARFQGADFTKRRQDESRAWVASSFRLAEDSPGKGAGEGGGRDLGADVSLVGPGPACDVWRKSPQYQEWLKATAPPQ